MAVCEIVGGPRDGERFTVAGSLPPEKIRVLATAGGPLVMWHPAAHAAYAGTQIVVCHLDDTTPAPARRDAPWRYLWPRQAVTSQ